MAPPSSLKGSPANYGQPSSTANRFGKFTETSIVVEADVGMHCPGVFNWWFIGCQGTVGCPMVSSIAQRTGLARLLAICRNTSTVDTIRKKRLISDHVSESLSPSNLKKIWQ